MHCRSCEILLEKNIARVQGVAKVRVNHKTGIATVTYTNTPPTITDIETVVQESGYSLGTDSQKPWFSHDQADYAELILAGAFLFSLYIILNTLGLLNIDLAVGSAPSRGMVMLVGVVASVSTCMALVGGLILGISARHAELHPEATVLQKFRPHLFFNLGRLLSYALLGGVIGLIGSALHL